MAALPVAGVAATYYVSPAGTASCAQAVNSATPASIVRGVTCVQAGDTLIALNGTYGPPATCAADSTHLTMALYLTASGTASKPITFKAAEKWGAILDSGSSCHSYIYFRSTANWWNIEGFDIRNGYFGAIYSNEGAGQNVLLACNHIHNIGQNSDAGSVGGAGIYTDNYAVMTIEGNLIHDIGPAQNSSYENSYIHGIYSHGNLTIVNNIFYNMLDGWAIQTAVGFQGTIENNTFYGPNGYMGGVAKEGQVNLWGAASGRVSVANNIFDMPYKDAIAWDAFSTMAGCTADNNLVHGVALIAAAPLDAWCTFSGNKATADASTDPEFVSVTIPDFHLRSGSPATDAGTAAGAPLYDFDGTPRPQGAGFDIGAYEYMPGIQGWWRFVLGPNDSSGNGNDGVLQNGPAYSAGPSGAAISLNGVSQYISVADNSSLDMTGTVTVAFWINPASVSGNPWVISKNYSWSVKLETGGYVQFTDHNGHYAELNYALTPGVWTHVAFTFDAASERAVTGYIDGSRTGMLLSSFPAGALPSTTNGIYMGSDSSGAAAYFPGLLDDVRVYNRVLSEDEIRSIYEAVSGEQPTGVARGIKPPVRGR